MSAGDDRQTDEGRGRRPTHLDREGGARMVDVSGKEETSRTAEAEGALRMDAATLDTLLDGGGPKGDALQVARVAGIQAGKRTGEWIPLCHLLPAVSIEVEFEPDRALPGIRVRTRARIRSSTGVEMEALTAASAALLTLYDMVKALDRGMVLGEIRLLRKEGGRSGRWVREEEEEDEEEASS